MGVEKFKRPVLAPGLQVEAASTFDANVVFAGSTVGLVAGVQSLTHADTATALTRHGMTFITSTSTAGTNIFKLPTPIAGARKSIVVDLNTTDAVDILTASSGETFFGSTTNALRFSTGLVAPKRAELLGRSTGAWAVVSLSTGVTMVASTE